MCTLTLIIFLVNDETNPAIFSCNYSVLKILQ